MGSGEAEKAVASPRRRNLILRGASALATLAILHLCLVWDLRQPGAWGWAVLMAVFSCLALREFYRFAEACGTEPFSRFGYAIGILWMLALEWDLSGGSARAKFPVQATDATMALAVVGPMMLQLARKSNQSALANVGMTVFGFLYCAYLPGYILRMRHLAFDPAEWPMQGVEFVVVCVFVAKVADVGALMTGNSWGRRKLIPRLSPGKTWEGAAGGLAFSLILLQLMSWTDPELCLNRLGGGMLLILSFILALAGLGGDLIESCFKRSSRMKDAGAGVPGFGGVLDLADSLILAGPVMFYFLLACGAREIRG